MRNTIIIALLLAAFAVRAEDKAIDAIVDRYEREESKAKETYDRTVKRSADYAIKKLERLEQVRTRGGDLQGALAVKAAIAKIKGEEFDPGDAVAGDDKPEKGEFPEGTFKYKGSHYYVLPKTKWQNYDEAEAACKELGGHILRLSSKKEHQYILKHREKELKAILGVILGKYDLREESKQKEQLDYAEHYAPQSTTVNYPYITPYGHGKISQPGSSTLGDREVYVICEWDY